VRSAYARHEFGEPSAFTAVPSDGAHRLT